MKSLSGISLLLSGSYLVIELSRGGFPASAAFACAVCGLWAASARASGGLWHERPTLAVFLLCLAAYLSTFRWHGGDDGPNSLIPLALLRHGTLALDAFLDPWFTSLPDPANFLVQVQGRHLSVYPIAPGLLATPLYAVTAAAHPPISPEHLHQLSKLSGAVTTAASAAVFHRALLSRAPAPWAAALALLYGLGSWAFSVSSQAIWQHGPAALGVALFLLGFAGQGLRMDLLAGFGLGLAVASRPDHVFVLGAALAFTAWRARGRLPGILAGGSLPAAMLVSYWYYYTGRPLPPEMSVQAAVMGSFNPAALAGLLLSPGRGLLWFFPPALLAIWAAGRASCPLSKSLLAAIGAQTLFYCFYGNWVGGLSFGTRYFASAAMIFCWCIAGSTREIAGSPGLRGLFCALAAASVLIHALGGYFNWPGSWDISETLAWVWDWRMHPAAFVFRKGGGLGGLPVVARLLIGAAALGAAAWAARRMHRALAAAA